ncbi:nucleotidyltransferase domain-containing protein [Persephonella sp.]
MNSTKRDVRLSEKEIKIIKDAVKKYDPDAKIIIFGSRTDLTKKGEDIDILVVSDKIDYRKRRKIRVDLLLKLGERKIDLIITDNPEKSEFTKMTYKYGIKI